MIERLQKIYLFIFAILALLFLVAAGDDSGSIPIGDLVQQSNGELNQFLVITSFMSVWILLLGVMCKTLEKIPGVKSDKNRPTKREP